MNELGIPLLVRFAVFFIIFALAVRKHPKISVKPIVALPLVAALFTFFNFGLYWIFKSVVNLATFGTISIAVPVVLNGLFLWATDRILKPLRIEGIRAMAFLILLLTLGHGVVLAVSHFAL